ncbi:GlsB/YeaQ/YmgE family stress response membrane protein [Mesobacillus maritimus]|uniref:GlsB/YeaQ/YmgE family stress response membrane protein n=1 Tax=Mesobacillus maritimus TaxID=1643336 RepID=UPI00203EA5B1|nr:GlsB/YeaQ/YmgE family stress response membrane protein [Mesobacillus maritimus]MCM3587448.1 GlsB/YeaQ/YmgE family stress response membrane protein [Mesobacillus maritimus]MCM3671095.1 GlsB/YeaQ/YmgE family stress response membrane protein [Mesobacillus maritimus]
MDLLTFIISALIAMVIGTVADKISPVGMPGGWAGAMIAGFIGAWIGPILLGTFGPVVAGFSLIPALIGAFVVVVVVGVIASIFR